MKTYKFLKHGPQYGHGSLKGDTVRLTDERAKVLLEANAIKEIAEKDFGELPENLPGKEHLTGFTVDDVKRMDAEMLQELKGIGKATAKAIVEYFEA